MGINGVKSWVYWITVRTQKGLEIEIFHLNGYDLSLKSSKRSRDDFENQFLFFRFIPDIYKSIL